MPFPFGCRRQQAAEVRMSVAALAAGIDYRRCTLAAVLRSSSADNTAGNVGWVAKPEERPVEFFQQLLRQAQNIVQ